MFHSLAHFSNELSEPNSAPLTSSAIAYRNFYTSAHTWGNEFNLKLDQGLVKLGVL